MRALYRRHVRGNSLLRNLGNGRFEDKTLEAHAEMGCWTWSSGGIDFGRDGSPAPVRIVQAGSGLLLQHSKELLIGWARASGC